MKQEDRNEIRALVSSWQLKAKECEAMAKQETNTWSSVRCTYEAEASTFKLCASELRRLLK